MKFSAAVVALAAALAVADAYVCRGTRSGGVIRTDVFITGGTCILQDVQITGSVFHQSGNLITKGKVTVSGSLTAHGEGTLELLGQTRIFGVFSVNHWVGSTMIGSGAVLGSVLIGDTDVFEARGTMTSLAIRTTKSIRLNGARILFGGLSVERSTSDVTICGSTVRGGIMLLETTGSLIAVSGAGCARNAIVGSIVVLKGTGNVDLSGSQVTSADLSISEQVGHVRVSNSALSDVAVGGVTGNINFTNVRTDSDATISGNDGSVTMQNSNVRGDMRISGNTGLVSLRNTNFNNDVVSVNGNLGDVDIYRNVRLSIIVNENRGDVSFVENEGTGATLNNNHKSVIVRGNTLTGLFCVDNLGTVTSGVPGKRTNTVNGVRSGQCWNV